jgi:hypothetical protein
MATLAWNGRRRHITASCLLPSCSLCLLPIRVEKRAITEREERKKKTWRWLPGYHDLIRWGKKFCYNGQEMRKREGGCKEEEVTASRKKGSRCGRGKKSFNIEQRRSIFFPLFGHYGILGENNSAEWRCSSKSSNDGQFSLDSLRHASSKFLLRWRTSSFSQSNGADRRRKDPLRFDDLHLLSYSWRRRRRRRYYLLLLVLLQERELPSSGKFHLVSVSSHSLLLPPLLFSLWWATDSNREGKLRRGDSSQCHTRQTILIDIAFSRRSK